MNTNILHKAGWVLTATVSLAALAALAGIVRGGPLDPTGPPSSTMKTLQEVEPRTPIESLPFTISTGGSYYLTGDLSCATVGCNGITVSADNVTIDLQGFALIGAPATNDGILTVATSRNLVVKNGILRNWHANGIDVGSNSSGTAQLIHLEASNNDQRGFLLGDGSTLVDCIARNNNTTGVDVTSNNEVVSGCLLDSNGVGLREGVYGGTGSNRITGNHAAGNSTGFAIEGSNNVVADNSAAGGTTGFSITGTGNQLFRNSVAGSTTPYSVGAGNDAGPIGTAATATSPWANVSN